MGLIPQSVIEEVLARADILDTVRQYVALKKAGANHKGLCPFHDENSPSFMVHPGKGIYKCFGCGEGGNVFQFLMKLEGWSFPETVRHLAERCGVEIEEEDPREAEAARRRREGKKLYYEVMEAARQFYEASLWGDGGQVARMYLKERGISEPCARSFGLGFAPDGWEYLLTHLKGEGYHPKVLQKAGLVRANDRGGHYDRFRNRVVFPVVDVWGHTLAFGGRTLASDGRGAKYLNSPETTFYTKGEQLYGLDVAKRGIQDEDFALLVEGNFDVIALHEGGLTMTVAPMGTALTERQARLMARFTRRVVVAFDGDDAGEEATLRCLPALEAAGLDARVVRFEPGDDPDTFVRREGAQALRAEIEAAPPLVSWGLEGILRPAEGAPIEERVASLEAVGEILDEISDEAVRRHYAEEIARRLSLEPAKVEQYIRRSQGSRGDVAAQLKRTHKGPRFSQAEFGVLVVLLDKPQWFADFFREELDKLLTSHELARLLKLARDLYGEHGELNGSLLLEAIERPDLRETVSQALTEPERGGLYPPDQSLRWYRDCVWTLKRKWAVRMDQWLQQELEDLDFTADRAQFEELHRQLEEIRQFRTALERDGAGAGELEGRAR